MAEQDTHGDDDLIEVAGDGLDAASQVVDDVGRAIVAEDAHDAGDADIAARDEANAARDADLAAGVVNLARFHEGPTQEVVLTWWNKQIAYSTRREHNDHEVLVVRETMPVWRVHIAVIAAVSALVLFTVGLLTGAPLWVMLLLVVLCVLIGMTLLRFERYLVGDSLSSRGEIVAMDVPVWEGMKQMAHMQLRRASDDSEVERSGLKAYLPVGKTTLTKVDTKLQEQCGSDAQRRYAQQLYATYDVDIALAAALGRGVRGCTCQACKACAAHDVVPKALGSQVALRQPRMLVGMTTGVGRWVSKRLEDQRKARMVRNVERDDVRKVKAQEREAEAQRKQAAREYVKARKRKGVVSR